MYEHAPTLSDRMRRLTNGLTERGGFILYQYGVHPDLLTILGLIVVAIAAVFMGRGQLQLGGVLLLTSLPLDALDGAVARAMHRQDKFGEVLDSTLDRFADGLIFGGFAYYFATQNQLNYVALSLAAMVGALVVSYVRARAGELNVKMKIGLFTRFERTVAILAALLVPPLLLPGIWVLALGNNYTAMQRLWYAYKVLHEHEKEREVS